MRSVRFGLLSFALILFFPLAVSAQYTLKEAKTALPAEVKDPIKSLIEEKSYQLLDNKNAMLCEVWFRKEIPGKATKQQVQNGLTYREIPETTLIGVIKVTDTLLEYRKQKIKPGIYTLRLGFQPQDGDHMGTSAHPEFLLAVPVAEDKGAATMEPKELHELSAKASGAAHPAVFMLFPEKAPDAAKLLKKEENHWALAVKLNVVVDKEKTTLGFALTLIGFSSAA